MDDQATPTATMGIKETMDLLNLVDAAISAFEQAKADGKFDIDDLKHVSGLVTAAVEAYKGSEQIVAELKDLDAAEAAALFQKLFTTVQTLLKAITAKEVSIPVMMPAV